MGWGEGARCEETAQQRMKEGLQPSWQLLCLDLLHLLCPACPASTPFVGGPLMRKLMCSSRCTCSKQSPWLLGCPRACPHLRVEQRVGGAAPVADGLQLLRITEGFTAHHHALHVDLGLPLGRQQQRLGAHTGEGEEVEKVVGGGVRAGQEGSNQAQSMTIIVQNQLGVCTSCFPIALISPLHSPLLARPL